MIGRVLVYEEVTGCCAGAPDARFLREAKVMVSSLVRDLEASPHVKAVTLIRDARLSCAGFPGEVKIVKVNSEDDAQNALLRELESLGTDDAYWPIAPEEDARLETLCAMGERASCHLLNSSPTAVRIFASKFETARLLPQDIACIPTWRTVSDIPADFRNWSAGYVVKPDTGAGGDGFRRVDTVDAACGAMRDGDIVQPYIEGRAMSVSLACGKGRFAVLSFNEQHLHKDSGRLRRCTVGCPIPNSLSELMLHLSVVMSGVGAAAYVGVDLIETAEHEYTVVEVNPRLTTSYSGIRAACGFNPVDYIVRYALGKGGSSCVFEPQTVVEVAV